MNYMHFFIIGVSLAMAPTAQAAHITPNSLIENNQTVSIQKKSFIDPIKQFITEHRTVVRSIALAGFIISWVTVGYSLANEPLPADLKKCLVAIMPFLAKETTKSEKINDPEDDLSLSWTTVKKIASEVDQRLTRFDKVVLTSAFTASLTTLLVSARKRMLKPKPSTGSDLA